MNTNFKSKSALKPGSLPAPKPTVTNQVLADLLSGEKLTAIGSVFGASTTRLAAFVWTLRHAYGWPVEWEDIVVETADGRKAMPRRYWLPVEVLQAAHRSPVTKRWVQSVLSARANLRAAGAARRPLAGVAMPKSTTIKRAFQQTDMWGAYGGY